MFSNLYLPAFHCSCPCTVYRHLGLLQTVSNGHGRVPRTWTFQVVRRWAHESRLSNSYTAWALPGDDQVTPAHLFGTMLGTSRMWLSIVSAGPDRNRIHNELRLDKQSALSHLRRPGGQLPGVCRLTFPWWRTTPNATCPGTLLPARD